MGLFPNSFLKKPAFLTFNGLAVEADSTSLVGVAGAETSTAVGAIEAGGVTWEGRVLAAGSLRMMGAAALGTTAEGAATGTASAAGASGVSPRAAIVDAPKVPSVAETTEALPFSTVAVVVSTADLERVSACATTDAEVSFATVVALAVASVMAADAWGTASDALVETAAALSVATVVAAAAESLVDAVAAVAVSRAFFPNAVTPA